MAIKDQGDNRYCTKCSCWKNRERNFHKNSKTGYFSTWCKDCKSKYHKDYWLRKNYSGLTLEEYENLLLKQEFRCAICKKLSDPLCVDHSHETGKIRGLLCHSCNLGIGYLQESLKILYSAIKYLA